jgi:hypothetical protein
LTQEQAQREEELRRKKKTEEIVNDAEREKQRHWLKLLTLIMLLTSCAGNSPKSGVNSQPVKQADFRKCRQKADSRRNRVCLPTCTKNQTVARRNR